MTDQEFDSALIAALFRLTAEQGWHRTSIAAAARAADLPLPRARDRFPTKAAALLRFGSLADQAALEGAPTEGPARDRLFDIVMRRFDAMQPHRDGIKALARALPFDPATALLLGCATRRSLRWMLQGAGIDTTGPTGHLKLKGLMAVSIYTLNAWDKDDSPDLSATMATLDKALGQAEQAASWLEGAKRPEPDAPPDAPFAEPEA
jgi:hypothetical protein